MRVDNRKHKKLQFKYEDNCLQTGKRCYSYTNALIALSNCTGRKESRIYKCEHCKKYHLTSIKEWRV